MDYIVKYPQKVTVQILRADNLLLNSDKKGKRPSKWKVVIMGSRKKSLTEYSQCPLGNPIWNSELTLKLSKDQSEPLTFVVIDFGNNQVGQVVVPVSEIKHRGASHDQNKSSLSTLICNELQASQKCARPTGHLFYRIWVDEYFPEELVQPQVSVSRVHSIFGWKHDPPTSNETEGTKLHFSHSEKSKASKRLSFFKANDKLETQKWKPGKAKSMANIHSIGVIEQSESSDSDVDRNPCFPPDNIYDHVTQDLGWVRVKDITEDSTSRRVSVNTNGGEMEKVDVWSVQPDNGPISGNFTVVMEGNNFSSGLFELTYICIDGLEPVDATNCTEIVSDTEMLLTMPPVSQPGTVNIRLELLDGSMIVCSKKFHYVDPDIEDSHCHIFTPRNDSKEFPDLSLLDNILDQYDDVLSSPVQKFKLDTVEDNVILKRDSGMGSFNDKINNGKSSRRRLSDYGSQGSIYSDRPPSFRRKVKHPTMSKMELFEEVNILRNEVANLQAQLKELDLSNQTQITAFKCQLETRDTEIDSVSHALCNLRVKLLEDGLTEYLELK